MTPIKGGGAKAAAGRGTLTSPWSACLRSWLSLGVGVVAAAFAAAAAAAAAVAGEKVEAWAVVDRAAARNASGLPRV